MPADEKEQTIKRSLEETLNDAALAACVEHGTALPPYPEEDPPSAKEREEAERTSRIATAVCNEVFGVSLAVLAEQDPSLTLSEVVSVWERHCGDR